MRDDVQAAVAIGREGETSPDVVRGEVGEIVENLGDGHAAAEVIEHVGHRDAGAPDAGFAAADGGVNGDAFAVIHVRSLVFQQHLQHFLQILVQLIECGPLRMGARESGNVTDKELRLRASFDNGGKGFHGP